MQRNLKLGLYALLVGMATALLTPARTEYVPTVVQGASVPQVIPGPEARKVVLTDYLASRYKQKPSVVRRYVDTAWAEAAKHPDVEPELILAIIQKESSFRQNANNFYGAEGLMQVVRRWHPEKLKPAESLRDPTVNIRVGTQIIQQYIKEKGRLDAALVKYSGNAKGYADFVLRERHVLKNLASS